MAVIQVCQIDKVKISVRKLTFNTMTGGQKQEEQGQRDRDRDKDRKTAESAEKSKEAVGHEFNVNARRIREWFGQKDELVVPKKKGKSK